MIRLYALRLYARALANIWAPPPPPSSTIVCHDATPQATTIWYALPSYYYYVPAKGHR